MTSGCILKVPPLDQSMPALTKDKHHSWAPQRDRGFYDQALRRLDIITLLMATGMEPLDVYFVENDAGVSLRVAT